MTFSRRKCLQALVLSAIPHTVFSQNNDKTVNWDLIIVGAGAAGLTAAVMAKQNGIEKVLVLESEPLVGGSSIISGGLWAVSGTELQKTHGILDSDDQFREDIFTVGAFKNRPDVVDAFIKNNRLHYQWLTRTLNIFPESIVPGAGIPRAHAFSMQTVISRLLILAQNLGVRILTGARVSELKSDNHKRITGVIAKHLEKRQLFTSRMGVILATGGFGRNVELMSQFSPRMKFVTSLCAQGARGDGLLLATQQEAALSDMEYLEGSYAFIKNPTTINDMSLLPYYGAIVINQRGERFVDESLPYKQIAKKVLYQPRGESSLVFDEYIRNLALKEKLDNHLWAPIDKGVLPDYVVKSSTVAGAAEKAGLDAITLVKTVTDYNRNVESDSPPRGPLSVNGGKLVQLIHPPFYIMPASVSILGTYCGVRIDGEARVLRADDTPIQGLWAAGEVTGGFHGASFIMGTAIAKAFVFGRVAVDSIVRRSAYA